MKTLRNLDWSEILTQLGLFASSGTARIAIAELAPLASASRAQDSFEEIQQASEVLSDGFRPSMESLDLFEAWYQRIKRKAVLKNLEIKDVRQFCLEAIALKEALRTVNNPLSRRCLDLMMKAEEPLSAIDQILTPRGEIRSDASETLYRLTREKDSLGRQIENTLDRLVKDHQMTPLLQDKYVTTREGRWVLPIRGGMQHYLPGVIHGSSQTKQTVFMEPETVVPLNNRLRQVEVEIEDEIERLLTQLSLYLAGKAWDFEKTKDLLLKMDLLFAKAQLAKRLEARPCEFSETEIFLIEVRHPLLVLSGKPVIGNSVQMPLAKRILLLSGPNAGGKTVLLKSIGLAAQMARCGLLIPAGEGSRLPFFKNILIGIGDSQSVGEDLSTFAAHLKLLGEASTLKGFDSLLLVDEICGSTDPEEGSSLARSFIEKFAANSIFGVITSHLSPLKSGWSSEDPILNGSLEYDLERGRPTYQFLQGIPGDSLALQTARRVGVDPKIVDRAIELLSPASRVRLNALEEIDQIKSDIQLIRESLKKDQQRAKNEKEKYEMLLSNIEKEKEKILSRIQKDTEKKVEELLSSAKAEQALTRHRSLQDIKINLPEIVKARPGPGLNTASADNAEEFAKRSPPGSKIFVPSLGQDGIVQSSPNGKGEVLVLSGSIRLAVRWQDLRSAQKPQNPTAELVRRSSGSNGQVSIALNDADRTLDLRGKSVDEALTDLEMELDQAARTREDRIKIIHGHGTETLKKSVRTYLSRSVYVKKWKAGSAEQGGDGVTWAELTQE